MPDPKKPVKHHLFMAGAAVCLVIFLWLMALPLQWLPAPIGPAAQQFANGARTTVLLTLVSGSIGLLIGVLGAMGKLSKNPFVAWPWRFYVWAIRGTPLLVQILFVYLALPAMFPALKLSDFNSAIIALALNVGAYNAEAMRGGILAVPQGQVYAAQSLGFPPLIAFRHVVFPQAVRISLPSFVNNLVSLLKDSSLAYAIGVVELSMVGNRVQAESFQPVPVFIAVACIYLILTTTLTWFSDALENQLGDHRR
ncbi:MAG: amino acid ABC transporter permease [Burkholderiales bacterium]